MILIQSILKRIFLKHPTKLLSFHIEPGGFVNGKKYLAYPNTNFFELASKRFCLRFSATGWVGDNDYLLPYAKYGVLQNDSGENLNGIGYRLAFDHGLTSLKTLGKMTEQEIIIYNLYVKLNPTLIKYYGNDIISATVNNINTNISNLNEQDKFILSLPTIELDNFIREENNKIIYTEDNNNEGNPNYDIQVFDYNLKTYNLDILVF